MSNQPTNQPTTRTLVNQAQQQNFIQRIVVLGRSVATSRWSRLLEALSLSLSLSHLKIVRRFVDWVVLSSPYLRAS
jgi:hypothetical protein